MVAKINRSEEASSGVQNPKVTLEARNEAPQITLAVTADHAARTDFSKRTTGAEIFDANSGFEFEALFIRLEFI
jgi:hypothetical protein